MSETTRAIREEIQRGYHDATQTVLDDRVAQAIEDRLRSMGWASPDEVRALVASAGGEIVLDPRFILDPPGEMVIVDDPRTWRRVVKVSISA